MESPNLRTLLRAPARAWGTIADSWNELRLRRHRRLDARFDEERGTDTAGRVFLEDLDLPADQLAQAVHYQATLEEKVEEILAAVPVAHERFAFVDVGSGKGRVLLVAARLPFREVIGVELSPQLHAIACRNIERTAGPDRRAREVRSTVGDATTFDLPPHPCLLYLYNPFREDAMQRFVANVERSVRANPREVHIAYYNPRHGSLIEASPLFRLASRGSDFAVYTT